MEEGWLDSAFPLPLHPLLAQYSLPTPEQLMLPQKCPQKHSWDVAVLVSHDEG